MWLFFALLGVGLVLTVFGFISDIPIFSMTGTIMLFLLGLALLNGGLDHKIGSEDVYVYGNNFSDYHWAGYNGSSEAPSQLDRDAFLFYTTTTDIYEPYDDFPSDIFAKILLFVGALGFCFSLFTLGGYNDD